MDEGTSVTIGGMSAKSVFVLGDMQIAATFDMSGVSAGTHSMEVRDGDGNSAILESAVNVQAPKIGPKLKAWLETPTVVRDGRVFAAYVCYKNEGDEPMTMPCFKVARTDSTTRMGLEASETMSDTELFIGGISPLRSCFNCVSTASTFSAPEDLFTAISFFFISFIHFPSSPFKSQRRAYQ